jgi:S-DNA-T family DNA segregation ATPase FtsK/SpoIIIE
VATKSKTSSSRSRSTGQRAKASRGRAPVGKKRTARGKSTAKSTARGKNVQRPTMGQTMGEALDGRGADLLGLFLIVVGILSALGIFSGTSGLLGQAFDEGFGWFMGVFRYLAPFAIISAGLAVIRRGGEAHALPPHFIVGGIAAIFSMTGLVHLAGDSPNWGSTVAEFSGAGGMLGLVVGGPLLAIASFWGALLILLAVGVGGLVVMTGTSLQGLLDAVARSARPLAGAAANGTKSLFVIDRDQKETIDLRDDTDTIDQPSVHVGGAAEDTFLDNDGQALDATIEIPVPREDSEPEAAAEATPAVFDQDIDTPAPAPTVIVPQALAPQQLETELAITTPGDRTWVLPPMSLLSRSSSQDVDQDAVIARGRTLERALAEHGVETRLINMVVGPTVTRFELELGLGVKVARVKNLSDDISYAMASHDVRIIAPIPGKQAIGVEVPNEHRQIIAVGDILGSPEAREAKGPMEVAIGRDINGKSLLADLSKMPHTLVAGATGAGKSSGINSIITSLLMRNTPDDVRMILIDPKRVEMTQYERIPHLLTQPVTDPKKAANALAWAVREMERRYELLEECRFRDIGGYNKAFDDGKVKAKKGQLGPDGEPRQFKRLPYILVVVDELADLMMVAARAVEDSIVRIGQKARAVGIHMVIATQRPSVDVITGLIKANVPARVAYAVASMQDSRVILGSPGAERLVGKGDMLFQDPTSSTPLRLQGAWVEESEVKNIVDHWRQQGYDAVSSADSEVLGGADVVPDIIDVPVALAADSRIAPIASAPDLTGMPGMTQPSAAGGDTITADRAAGDDTDDLLWQAMELVVSSGLGSTSMLQRKLRVGFSRAGRIMDELEQKGIVGPSEGSKAREVLLSPEQLLQLRNG